MVPGPIPLLLGVIVTQSYCEIAVQAVPGSKFTVKVPVPPLAANDWLVGDRPQLVEAWS